MSSLLATVAAAVVGGDGGDGSDEDGDGHADVPLLLLLLLLLEHGPIVAADVVVTKLYKL